MCVCVFIMEKTRCKKCNSTQIYHRLTTSDILCRKCGATTSIKQIEEKEVVEHG